MNSSKVNAQSGVTMLMALFIMTGMVAIAAFIGPLINSEISQSYASITADQMFYQARGQSEQSLFFLVRNRTDLAPVPDCSESSATTQDSTGVRITNCRTLYYSNPYTVVLPTNGQTNLYLYDPHDSFKLKQTVFSYSCQC